MADANAQIGVAVAANFPSLSLSADVGSSGSPFRKLVTAPNRVWAIGPQLAETLFDGGLRRAQVAAAKAGYINTVATYRETVLAGLEQVEDDVITLKVLEEQAEIEDKTVKAAREAEALTLNQ